MTGVSSLDGYGRELFAVNCRHGTIRRIFKQARGSQPGRDKRRGHTSAGMRACPHKIEVVVARVPVARAQVSQLGQRVAEAMR